MKIQYASDLYLEFHENSRWLKDNPLIPVGDVLVFADDIGYLGNENYDNHPFWNWCSELFRQTIVIPGDHELYKSYDINGLHKGWQLKIRPNVKAHYNCVIPLSSDIELIVSTLWAKIYPYDEYLTERGMTDFHRIRDGKSRLSAQLDVGVDNNNFTPLSLFVYASYEFFMLTKMGLSVVSVKIF